MQTTAATREEVLQLLSEGKTIWYFYLNGAMTIFDGYEPTDKHCPVDIFLALKEEKTIMAGEKVRYASTWPAQIYSLSNKS